MRLKLRIGCICISILFVYLLSSNILSNLPTVLAQGDQPTEDMPRLVITPDTGYVLDAGQRFSVKITKNSSDGIEVEGVGKPKKMAGWKVKFFRIPIIRKIAYFFYQRLFKIINA